MAGNKDQIYTELVKANIDSVFKLYSILIPFYGGMIVANLAALGFIHFDSSNNLPLSTKIAFLTIFLIVNIAQIVVGHMSHSYAKSNKIVSDNALASLFDKNDTESDDILEKLNPIPTRMTEIAAYAISTTMILLTIGWVVPLLPF